MIQENSRSSDDVVSGRVEIAIAEYLSCRGALEQGEWLSRYPDCRDELLEFIDNQRAVGRVAAAFLPAELPAACRIGNYEILDVVDRGGMGVVYRARHTELGRIVALKMILQGRFASPEAQRRFLAEFRLLAELQHSNLVDVYEVGEHNGMPWFSMEFVNGRTLSDLARQGRIRPQVVAEIAQSIAETMHYAHGTGIVHRDLKPSNVMIDDRGNVRVTDFGLAKQLDRSCSVTDTGQILGSIDYMSPEQSEAQHSLLGPASDVYSIGALMYELLTGRPPFRSDAVLKTLRQIREEAPIRPRVLNPRVPPALEAVCLRCLEKNPADRYATAEQLALDLDRVLNDQPLDVPPGARVRSLRQLWRRLMRQRQSAMLIASLLLSSLVAGRWTATLSTPPSEPGEPVSVAETTGTQIPVVPQMVVPGLFSSVPKVTISEPPPAPRAMEPAATAPPAVGVAAAAAAHQAAAREKPTAGAKAAALAKPDAVAEQGEAPAAVVGPPAPHRVVAARAVSGVPLGVGMLELELSADQPWQWRPDVPLTVQSADGRVHYAAFRHQPAKHQPADRQAVQRQAAQRQGARRQPRPEQVDHAEQAGGQAAVGHVAAPARLTAWYLFRGEPPTSLRLISADQLLADNIAVQAVQDPVLLRSLRNDWWRHYAQVRTELPALSPELLCVQDYLLDMLARRFKLFVPATTVQLDSSSALEREFERAVGMLFGFESVRRAMMDSRSDVTYRSSEKADLPLPSPLQIRSVAVPSFNHQLEIEPLAGSVPEECFYLRCYRVENYAWVRSLIRGWGGSVDSIVAVPAVDHQVRERLERQLAFSPVQALQAGIDQELTDCALIGLDSFFHEGPAIGVLLEARPGGRLGELLQQQREEACRQADVLKGTETIGGQTVSLLTAPGNVVRSFYVVSDRYHLLTNSKVLATRFLEARKGYRSLGSLREYQYAQQELQADRDCLAVLYLSDPFFRQITSPAYRVELQRRRRAAAELTQLQLARMAAAAEGLPASTVAELQRLEFLPATCGRRPDGSFPEYVDGCAQDSLRGCRGTFLPVADVGVKKVTISETREYAQFSSDYRREWQNMDPVLLTFRRERAAHVDRERIVMNIRITPYAQETYGFLQRHLQSEPQSTRVRGTADELLSISGQLQGPGAAPWVHVGLADALVDFELRDGEIRRTGPLSRSQFSESHSFAVVSPGDPASLRLLAGFAESIQHRDWRPPQPVNPPRTEVPRQAGQDPVRLLLGVGLGGAQAIVTGSGKPLAVSVGEFLGGVRPNELVSENLKVLSMMSSDDDWTVLSRNPELRRNVLQSVELQPARRPAQLFMQLRDVSSARVFPYVRAYTYMTSRRAGAADAALLNRLSASLQLPPEQVRGALQTALGAELRCPVGGTWELCRSPHNADWWQSSGWDQPSYRLETKVPEDYQFPFLSWLHSLELECSLTRTTLLSRLELEVTQEGDYRAVSIPWSVSGQEPLLAAAAEQQQQRQQQPLQQQPLAVTTEAGEVQQAGFRTELPAQSLVDTDTDPNAVAFLSNRSGRTLYYSVRYQGGTWSGQHMLSDGRTHRFEVSGNIELRFETSRDDARPVLQPGRHLIYRGRSQLDFEMVR